MWVGSTLEVKHDNAIGASDAQLTQALTQCLMLRMIRIVLKRRLIGKANDEASFEGLRFLFEIAVGPVLKAQNTREICT